MEAFHFLRPWWLLAVLPWLVLTWRVWRGDVRRGAWREVCDEALLPFILEGGKPARRSVGIVLLALAGVLAIVALAGPAWREIPLPVYRQQEALVVALDLSRSMDASDIQPSRVARARMKLLDLLRQRQDGQTALLAYAGDAFTVTPLTDDVNTISALVSSLTTDIMPAPGTRTDRAIDLAQSLLEQSGSGPGRVVLITDDVGTTDTDAAVARLRNAGHRLSVIGVGTPEGAPIPAGNGELLKDDSGRIILPRLPEVALRGLASAGGGRYAGLSLDDSDLSAVLSGTDPDAFAVEGVAGLTSDRWREEGPWLLLLLLPLASGLFRRGLLAALVCVLVPVPETASAMDWGGLWRNADQRGEQAFRSQDYAGAAEAFRDPSWKAAALYRAGRFEEAASLLATLPEPDALYNRGNALARLGRFEEAAAVYEQVLRLEPDHEDARYNLELLRRLEPPPPQGGGQGEQPPDGSDGQQGGGDRGSPQEGTPGEGDQGSSADGPQQGSEQGPHGARPEPGEAGHPERGDNDRPQQEADSGPRPDGEAGTSPSAADPRESDSAESQQPPRGQTSDDDLSPSEEESRQAMQQWLRRIPDDPGGLLRRKFRYQYGGRDRGAAAEAQPW